MEVEGRRGLRGSEVRERAHVCGPKPSTYTMYVITSVHASGDVPSRASVTRLSHCKDREADGSRHDHCHHLEREVPTTRHACQVAP